MPETTIQPAAAAGLDTWLNGASQATNYETSTGMTVGRDDSGAPDINRYRIVLKFDLSSIPAGSTIQEAILTLYAAAAGTDKFMRLNIARILPANSGWSEVR